MWNESFLSTGTVSADWSGDVNPGSGPSAPRFGCSVVMTVSSNKVNGGTCTFTADNYSGDDKGGAPMIAGSPSTHSSRSVEELSQLMTIMALQPQAALG